MTDTRPDGVARYRALLLERSDAERFVMGTRMFDAARAIVLASFPPDLEPDEMRRRLFARFYADLPAERVPKALREPSS